MLPVILVAVTVGLIMYYFHTTFTYWERKKIPSCPSPSLITGHSNSHFLSAFNNIYNYFKQMGEKHGGFYFIHQPIYMPLDPDLIKQVMAKDFDYFNEKGFYFNERDQPINVHLFNIGGDRWKKLRVKLTPTFTSGKLKNMFPTILNCATPLLEAVERCTANEQVLNIKDIASKFTTDVVGSCAFGIECNSFQNSQSDFHKNGRKIMVPTAFRLLKATLGMSFPKICRFFRMVITPSDVAEFYTNITKDTIMLREKNNIQRNDFLHLLMNLRDNENPNERINVQEIINQSFIFYIAGYETSSSVMTFALLEIARNPDMQARLRQEIFDVLQMHNNEITYDAIHDMKYLTQVVDETLRMYPPLFIVNRCCNKDYQIPGTDITLQKDTRVFIPVYPIHHDEKYYPDPETFDPERFSDENRKRRHPYTFLPFGEGPRLCIGMRFGYLQTKIGLAVLLRKFKFTLHSSIQYPIKMKKSNLILAPALPILLNSTPL